MTLAQCGGHVGVVISLSRGGVWGATACMAITWEDATTVRGLWKTHCISLVWRRSLVKVVMQGAAGLAGTLGAGPETAGSSRSLVSYLSVSDIVCVLFYDLLLFPTHFFFFQLWVSWSLCYSWSC